MASNARYTATRPQIQSDFMKQCRGRVPAPPRAHFYERRYPRDCVPPPPADCPRVSGPAITKFRDSIAVDDAAGTITATDARGRVHTFHKVACTETRPPVSSTSQPLWSKGMTRDSSSRSGGSIPSGGSPVFVLARRVAFAHRHAGLLAKQQ